MKTIPVLVASAFVVGACATDGKYAPTSSTPGYWTGSSSSAESFRHDSAMCAAHASRLGNVMNVPDNRIDRPIQPWPNAEAQGTYEACMARFGWHAAG